MLRSRNTWLWIGTGGAMVAGLVILAFALGSQDIRVRIFNDADKPLTDVVLTYGDRTDRIDNMAPGAMRQVRIRPVTDSGMSVAYIIPGEPPCETALDVYLAKGLQGTVDIHVDNRGKISVTSNLSP